jgi:hypothetical protein
MGGLLVDMGCGPSIPSAANAARQAAANVQDQRAKSLGVRWNSNAREQGGGGKEPSAAELKVMLVLLENIKIKDGKVNSAAESDIMERVESPFNRQMIIDVAKNNSSKAATAIKILRILFEIDSAKKCFTAAEKREVKTIFQREGGVTRRLKRR